MILIININLLFKIHKSQSR